VDDYVIDGDLVFSDQSSALKFYREQYHKKKEWVGLTDEELLDLADMAYANDLELLQTLQAKLKEKNT
jgi:hypothetical protein